jgi:hypothetical protein
MVRMKHETQLDIPEVAPPTCRATGCTRRAKRILGWNSAKAANNQPELVKAAFCAEHKRDAKAQGLWFIDLGPVNRARR